MRGDDRVTGVGVEWGVGGGGGRAKSPAQEACSRTNSGLEMGGQGGPGRCLGVITLTRMKEERRCREVGSAGWRRMLWRPRPGLGGRVCARDGDGRQTRVGDFGSWLWKREERS